jgi:hypothetical protein
MKHLFKKRLIRFTAIFLAINLLFDTLLLPPAYALTAGPASPEFSSFEPVATTDMVNLFSGDFNYNLPVIEIPGPDGGGYAMSLSYHSGASCEEEASWVGFGWSLNPGAINRNTRGFPDDYDGTPVTRYNKTRVNWSVSLTNEVGADIFAKKERKKLDRDFGTVVPGSGDIGLTASTCLRFNNYQGFSRYYSFGLSAAGLANIKMDVGAQGPTFSAGINVPTLLSKLGKQTDQKPNDAQLTAKQKIKRYVEQTYKSKNLLGGVLSQFGSTHGIYGFNEEIRATSMSRYTGGNLGWNLGLTVNPAPVPIGVNTSMSGQLNFQRSTPSLVYNAYGYMNYHRSDDRIMNDYFVERGHSYSRRDLFLSIPFNNADVFSVVGEGMSGGFRFFPNQVRNYYPDFVSNTIPQVSLGLDGHIGTAVGFGIAIGLGVQNASVKNWDATGNSGAYQSPSNSNAGVFRFNNDMGGKVEYGNSRIPSTSTSLFGGPQIDEASVTKEVNPTGFSNSSFIAYHTASDFTDPSKKKFNEKLNIIAGLPSKSITELSVYNADGVNYIYGEPVFARNDLNVQVDVPVGTTKDFNHLAYKADGIKPDFNMELGTHKTAVGELRQSPNANTYLLTQIFSPDYVDVTTDGPSNDDFGGWTSFAYHTQYGGDKANNWYRWRSPYMGLNFDRNQISDEKDDMGAVATGEKQIKYLKAVETKTHIAFFVTNLTNPQRFSGMIGDPKMETWLNGSGKVRKDGMDAGNSDGLRNKPSNAKSLEHLERIVLFAKARPDKPLKIVNLAYDYSLVQNLPNNMSGNYPDSKTNDPNATTSSSGKLTLKKVWFEYEGTFPGKISPYEFTYAYKDKRKVDADVKTDYQPIMGDVPGSYPVYGANSQNPDYNPFWLDTWGNIQVYGKERKNYMIPWVYQGGRIDKTKPILPGDWRGQVQDAANEYDNFDPAAWQLKQIKLPSGGEILVEYEQKDYAYVQDRSPMVMASLLKPVNEPLLPESGTSTSTYTINTADLGIKPDEIDELVAKMEDIYLVKKEKIYFKFLYKIVGDGTPDLNDNRSEYITGYSSVSKVEAEASGKNIVVTLEGKTSDGRTELPRQACYDFYSTQRMNKHWSGDIRNVPAFENQYQGEIEDLAGSGSVVDRAKALTTLPPMMLKMAGFHLDFSNFNIPEKNNSGKSLNPTLSFLKIPTIKAKKGGGVRVKRLMMYDEGIETGDASLFGQEYYYQDVVKVKDAKGGDQFKIISSGVATNEPSEAREENPLVGFLPRNSQSWYSRVTAGIDKEQTEGPLGESLLPGASVGHSRVIVQNIFKGKTNNGFTVQEYYTCKDYPYDKTYVTTTENDMIENPGGTPGNQPVGGSYKAVDYTSVTSRSLPIIIPAGLFNFQFNKLKATQGYRFVVNNMHGSMKRTANYAGIYDPTAIAGDFYSYLKKFTRISGQEVEYYEPGEKVKMLNPDGTYKMDVPGKEMDVTMEMKSIAERTLNLDIQFDLLLGTVVPPPVYTPFSLSVRYADNAINTHVTSKVIRYPVMVKRTLSFQDGVTSISENLAFSPITGSPIVTKTYDGFHDTMNNDKRHDGSLYSVNLPASWYYPEMGPKFADGQLHPERTNELSASAGSIVAYGNEGNPLTPVAPGTPGWLANPKNIINASVQTFKNNWFPIPSLSNDYLENPNAISPDTRASLNAIWRPEKSYVYRQDVQTSNSVSSNIRQGGIINTFTPFFKPKTGGGYEENPQPQWILGSQVIAYSQAGNAIEEKNVLDIYSAVRFGYKNTLPVMVSGNARYGAIAFEDYENESRSVNTNIDPGMAHSGDQSLKVRAGTTVNIFNRLTSDRELISKGAWARVWIRSDDPASPNNSLEPTVAVASSAPVEMIFVAQSGDWALYKAFIKGADFPATGLFPLSFTSSVPVHIDDVRFQPFEAQATCYVYDIKTLRLITQFDDQHFGMFYQYNSEGKLVRKLIETERGLKTVQETQYNTLKKSRAE